MAKSGPTTVKRWMKGHGVTARDLQSEIGDRGGQTQRWLSGDRPTLPLGLKALIAQKTGISIHDLMSPRERIVARNLVAVMGRDAA